MNYIEDYKNKTLSAKEAAQKIPSNSTVVLGHAAATPKDVVDAMVENKENFKNVEIIHMLSLGKGEYMKEDMEPHFRHNALFVGGNSRKAVMEGRADYTPCFFYEVPRLFSDGYINVDVCIVQLSKPDDNGYCSFGVACDYTKVAAQCSRILIAEVNDKMPRVMGDNFIHVSEIDYIIETSNDIFQLPPPTIGDVEKAIGENCSKLIEDGATLQLGIGAIPDAVLMSLKNKKNLGIHTEMFSDGVLDLIESGVINGSAKTLHRGKIISTFIMGSKRLYDYIDNNPDIELYPVSYVNHPCTIMQNENIVSINSCIEVDLMGQIVSETIGTTQFSGVGGQVDYVRGASMAKHGKSIIAIPSTASQGKVSRIVPFVTEGSAVTTSRNDVNYVVTEYGIANLKGKTLKERARLLIEIAHPDFREELEKVYDKRFNKK